MHSSGSSSSYVVLIVLVAIVIMVRRGQRASKSSSLNTGERVRPLAITLLDPVISLIIIGGVWWKVVSSTPIHASVAVLGGAVGLVIGWTRARIMFVRAVKETKSVVLRRSSVEYGLLTLLLALRFLEGSVKNDHAGLGALALAALVSLALVETISRSAFIAWRYVNDRSVADDVGDLNVAD